MENSTEDEFLSTSEEVPILDVPETKDANMTENYANDYLHVVIDHGGELQRNYETGRRDIQTQMQHVRAEVAVIREVLAGIVYILMPVLAGWVIFLFTKLLTSRIYENYAVAINCGILISILICDGKEFLDTFQQLLNCVDKPASLLPNQAANTNNEVLSSTFTESCIASDGPKESAVEEEGETTVENVQHSPVTSTTKDQ